jgi:hypothetical protein
VPLYLVEVAGPVLVAIARQSGNHRRIPEPSPKWPPARRRPGFSFMRAARNATDPRQTSQLLESGILRTCVFRKSVQRDVSDPWLFSGSFVWWLGTLAKERIESVLLDRCGTYRYFLVFASVYPLGNNEDVPGARASSLSRTLSQRARRTPKSDGRNF